MLLPGFHIGEKKRRQMHIFARRKAKMEDPAKVINPARREDGNR
jgi:hypothetical protein